MNWQAELEGYGHRWVQPLDVPLMASAPFIAFRESVLSTYYRVGVCVCICVDLF